MTRITKMIVGAVLATVLTSGDTALAFRGGRGGGGFRGGGGGFRGSMGGAMGRPGGFGGAGRPGGFGGVGGMGRPGGFGGVGGMGRPGGVGGVGRPGGVGGVGGIGRPGGVGGVGRPGGVGGVGGVGRPGGVGGVGGVGRPGGVGGVGRPGGNNFGNRTNNFNQFNNNTNRYNNFNNFNRGYGGYGYGGFGGRGYGYGWPGRMGYGGYHTGWVNGYWTGNGWGGYGNGLGWGLGGLGLGLGLGMGLGGWGYGSSLYNWGYSPYYNPYYIQTAVVGQPVAVASSYDYAQPIDSQSPPPATTDADASVQRFDDARAAFKQGAYPQALQLTDQALDAMPNDPTMHEFRALTLFALQKYDQAAAALYAVLSTGPGWDWTTMIGLYPDIDTYTNQLRTLEQYCKEHSQDASSRFVLAYHYLTEGYPDSAASILKTVVALQPKDTLSARLLASLTKGAAPTGAGSAADTAAPAEPSPDPNVKPGEITGNWSAQPASETKITLTLKPDGKFNWGVNQAGKSRDFGGSSSYAEGLLTLAPTEGGNALVGKVLWKSSDQFVFRVVGADPGDPGLTFKRQ